MERYRIQFKKDFLHWNVGDVAYPHSKVHYFKSGKIVFVVYDKHEVFIVPADTDVVDFQSYKVLV